MPWPAGVPRRPRSLPGSRFALAVIATAALLLSACTRPLLELPEEPARELTSVPFFPQTRWHCGPAALATTLVHTGVAVTPDELAPQVYVPARRGSFQPELVAAARTAGRIPYVIEPSADDLFREVAAGNPVLVLQDLGRWGIRRWHYAVVVGTSPGHDLVVLRSGTERRRLEPRDEFLRSWEPGGRWALVVNRPGELPATAEPAKYLRALADASRHLDPDGSARAHAAALARWPDDPGILFAAANERYSRQDLGTAEELYRRLLTRDPAHVAGRNNLANLLIDRGCVREARQEAEAALAAATPDNAFLGAIRDTLERARALPPGDCPAPAGAD